MPAFLADECFSGQIFRVLQAAGLDVVRSIDHCPAANDETVLAFAFAQNRILLTEDYGFGELCIRLGMPTRGVVIVAVKGLSAERQGARVIECLAALGDRAESCFVTIEPARVRLRPLPQIS